MDARHGVLAMLQGIGRAGFDAWRATFGRVFDASQDPLRHLGALTIFFLWIVLVSGIWLFAFFETSVLGAYGSVERLTHEQWYLGGVMRSLHRYASDALIVTLLLHILKEFSHDRHRARRWFSWVTGVPLLWLIIPLGITGYWLVWDALAQYVALTSAELLDRLPIFTDPMARNFLSDSALSDRFFTLMAFLHLIGLPIFLVFGIWLHVFRISGPRINPPRALMAGALLAMLLVSVAFPAVSQGPAELDRVPAELGLDWFYLPVYPLVAEWSPGWVWALLLGISLLLCLAPWLPPARPRPVAVVDLANCNGCERCVDDCPFDAVSMAPRSDGAAYAREAVVDADRCVACGLCVGACPTATPFRVQSALVPGIDLPDLPVAELRRRIQQATWELEGEGRVLVIACGELASPRLPPHAHAVLVPVRCVGQLPPSFVDYVLSRGLADGVLLAACAGGDCQSRNGTRWAAARIARERDPMLRKRVDDRRIALSWLPPWNAHPDLVAAVAAFRAALASGAPAPTPAQRRTARWRPAAWAAAAVAGVAFALLVGLLSVWPRYRLLEPGQAMVSLTFSHAGQRLEACHERSAAELAALPPNMRNPTDCPRQRRPIEVELSVDGEVVYRATHAPSGLWDDGESTVYARLPVAAGLRRLQVGMRDSGRAAGFDHALDTEVEIDESRNLVVEFDAERRAFVVR